MFTKGFLAVAAALMVAGVSVLAVSGSSHSDAPLISQDREANNTDVYAFVSTETGRSDHVTLIANYIPNEEPIDGPHYQFFGNDVLYEIHVDVDGDAKDDLTYQFDFQTTPGALASNTFLYNLGTIRLPIKGLINPRSQYINLNMPTNYTLKEIRRVVGEDNKKGKVERAVLLEDARAAPIHVGPQSTGTPSDYESLAQAAVHTIGQTPDDIRVFAGPRDEGFYVDLGGCCFDLINLRDPGVDAFSGFNVHSIAIEVPKSRFGQAGDTDGVIGVWASASRQQIRVLGSEGRAPDNRGPWVQVSRLGNPLVNELLIPLSFKDAYNASHPTDDEKNIGDFIVNPGSSGAELTLTPLLVGFLKGDVGEVNCNTPVVNRSDLELALLTGIPAGKLALPTGKLAGKLGFPGNQDTQQEQGPAIADMLRLNYNVDPAEPTGFSPLGIFEGDMAGFPNGRRVEDDVVDIEARVATGAVLHLLGDAACEASLSVSDKVQTNDVPYLTSFPYLGTPHQGYDHKHKHGSYSMTTTSVGIGSGLLAGGLLLGGVFALRRRRSSVNS
ncbi:MAG TPA: DUF4331 domain-containing protein [Dehalococcoidia bacterium]|nr:DUF4331 domain-containing protein [Dehalococcoidia bacterium]